MAVKMLLSSFLSLVYLEAGLFKVGHDSKQGTSGWFASLVFFVVVKRLWLLPDTTEVRIIEQFIVGVIYLISGIVRLIFKSAVSRLRSMG